MRVVYYGHELYHGSEWHNHAYIDKIRIGDTWKYFYNQAELAAYKAGKAAKGAVDAVGKAVGDAATKIKNDAYTNSLKKKYAGSGKKIHDALDNALSKRAYKGETVNKSVERQKNEAASKAAGTRKWDARVDGYSRHLENLNSSKTKRADGMYNLDREVTEKEKKQNASVKTGEEAVREARRKKQSNAPKNNQGYVGQKSPKVSGKPLTGNSGKKYDSKKINDGTFSAGSGRLDNGTVDRFHVNTDQFKKHKTGSKLKAIEDSYFKSYVNQGFNPERARKWAKQAAENYMKKHG